MHLFWSVSATKKTRCGEKKKEEKDSVDAKNVSFISIISALYNELLFIGFLV